MTIALGPLVPLAWIALAPIPASNTWAGKPRTFKRNQITPTCERTIFSLVGSGMKQASAR